MAHVSDAELERCGKCGGPLETWGEVVRLRAEVMSLRIENAKLNSKLAAMPDENGQRRFALAGDLFVRMVESVPYGEEVKGYHLAKMAVGFADVLLARLAMTDEEMEKQAIAEACQR